MLNSTLFSFHKIPPFAVIIYLCISCYNILYSQWTEQQSGTKASLKDICFVDSLNGWIVGDSVTILHTTNGGQNWIKQSSPTDTINLLNVRFVDNKVGYITAKEGSYLKTTDGGINWTHNILNTDYYLEDICFINKDTGWVAAYDFYITQMKGVLFYTSDGGNTWIKQLEVGSADNLYNRRVITAVNFLDKTTGWVFVTDGIDPLSSTYVYRTPSGGRNWFIIGELYNVQNKIICVSKDTLWAGPGDYAISVDGGINWIVKVLWKNILDIALTDGSHGWVSVIRNIGQDDENLIFYTEDGGENWSEIFFNNGPPLKCLENIKDRFLWAAGEGGKIIRYSKYSTPVEDNNVTLPIQTDLLQNYPNPFNPSTTIKFTIPASLNPSQGGTLMTLKVYDILGREVKTLVDENKTAGEYSITWDGKDKSGNEVSSGIYFYNIRFQNNSITKKMLLVR